MESDPTPPRISLRVVFRGGRIWFSELVGILFVAAALMCLSACGAVVLVNESAIRGNARTISRLKTERIVLTHTLDEWREKATMSAVLTEFVKNRLPRQNINMLVDLVYKNSTTYGYDPLLVLAVIHVESFFETEALGQYKGGTYSGALGLMQLMFETAQEVAGDLGMTLESVEDVFVPEVNIALGVAYLTRLIAQFKSLRLGILAYNQGPAVVAKSISRKSPLSATYYNKVLRSYYRLKQMRDRSREPDA
jgi:soluble lytic murein transglycosylase-like protein